LRQFAVRVGAHKERGTESEKRSQSRVQQATVYVSASGLTFIVHGLARQSQASVDIHSGFFSEYTVLEERIDNEVVQGGEFCISLPTLLESLHVLGSTPKELEKMKLIMYYDRLDASLKVELEDKFGVLATTAITGSIPEFDYFDSDASSPSLSVAFRNHQVVARAIVKSDYFKAGVSELTEVGGASSCTIAIANDRMELGAVGYAGECLVEMPKCPDAFVSLFAQDDDLHKRSYPINSLLQGMRGLDIANETCISINENGMIAIQHQVLDPLGSGEPSFIDFLMTSLEEDVDNESHEKNTISTGSQESIHDLSRQKLINEPDSDELEFGAADSDYGKRKPKRRLDMKTSLDVSSLTPTGFSQLEERSSLSSSRSLDLSKTNSQTNRVARAHGYRQKFYNSQNQSGDETSEDEEQPKSEVPSRSQSPELLFAGNSLL